MCNLRLVVISFITASGVLGSENTHHRTTRVFNGPSSDQRRIDNTPCRGLNQHAEQQKRLVRRVASVIALILKDTETPRKEICDSCDGKYRFNLIRQYPDRRESSCYLRIDDAKDYESAKKACENTGGSLVSIESREEQNHIHRYMADHKAVFLSVWTSGRNIDGQWIWTANGKKFKFENWADAQPLTVKKEHSYLSMSGVTFKWFISWHKTLGAAICERQARCRPLVPWD